MSPLPTHQLGQLSQEGCGGFHRRGAYHPCSLRVADGLQMTQGCPSPPKARAVQAACSLGRSSMEHISDEGVPHGSGGKPMALTLAHDDWEASVRPGAAPDTTRHEVSSRAFLVTTKPPPNSTQLSSATCTPQPSKASQPDKHSAILAWSCKEYTVEAVYTLQPTGAFVTKVICAPLRLGCADDLSILHGAVCGVRNRLSDTSHRIGRPHNRRILRKHSHALEPFEYSRRRRYEARQLAAVRAPPAHPSTPTLQPTCCAAHLGSRTVFSLFVGTRMDSTASLRSPVSPASLTSTAVSS